MSNTVKAKPLDLKAKLAAAKRPQRVVPINLRGDLIAEVQELNEELGDLQRETAGDRRLAEHPRAAEIVARIDAIKAEAEESELELRLQAVPGERWRRALTDNPPAEIEKDEGYIANTNDVAKDLFPESIISPDLDDEDIASLLDVLADAQWQMIVNTIWHLNSGDNKIPFSSLASQARRSSDDEQKSPELGE